MEATDGIDEPELRNLQQQLAAIRANVAASGETRGKTVRA
jgi:hypothetical protein